MGLRDTLRKKLPNPKPLQANGALGSSASHQAIKNNEGDIVIWLGAFLQWTVTTVTMAGNSNGAVPSA